MKIWHGYGSEHSGNLVLIGTFSSAEKADEAAALLDEAASIAQDDERAGTLVAGRHSPKFSDRMLEFLMRHSLGFAADDPEQLLYEFHARRESGAQGERVVITTEESAIQAFLKVMLHKGAKIEVYSAHDHGGPYGRRTR